MNRSIAAVATFAVLATAPLHAGAQQPRAQTRPATDGVDRLYHDYSGEGDASSIELNPALLSAIKGFDLTLLGYKTVSNFTRGTGFGGFAALGLGLGFALGFGAQYVRPGLGDSVADFDAALNPDITKISFAFSGGMGEFGSFGLGIHGVRSSSEWLQRPDIDLGVMSRILNYGSLGVAARLSPVDLRSDNLRPQFSLVGELAVRPLGTHHIELAGGVRSLLLRGQPGTAPDSVGLSGLLPRGRMSLRYQGIAVRGEVEQVQAMVLDPGTFDALREERALRGSVSIELSWDYVTAGGGVHAGVSDGIDGYGFHARVHTRRRGRVYWPRRVDAERIKLKDVDDERSFVEMLERLERAQKAGSRAVLVVDARDSKAGWASLHELRRALVRVRNSGGHVYAYVEDASLKDYYVATAAQKIFIHPAGGLEAYGLSSTSLYFRKALDKIGVRAEVVRVDEYKSAMEPFTHEGPSDPARRQTQELLRDTYGQIVFDIAQGRGKSKAEVRKAFDDAPYGPKQAVEAGLADKVVFRDQIVEEISEEVGAQIEFKEIRRSNPQDPTWSTAPYIAVVLVEDTIIEGRSRHIPFIDLNFAGGDTIAETLRKVRADVACKGVILRVNSPGGSALASDIIWREVQRTTDEHEKDPRGSPPIVVSMGDVAASGGYYVATGAPHVFADPMTVTGSIGVISLHVDLSGLLGKLGINPVTFKEGKNPDISSLFKPYTADQRARIEKRIRGMYDLFRKRVADGRKMTMDKVDQIGRGHVYSGSDAKRIGLIDSYGGLHDAIAYLRDKAGVRRHRKLVLRVLPKKPRIIDLILDNAGDPFAGKGPIRRAVKRRRDRENRAALRAALPLALNETLSRAPLSLLYLQPHKAHVVMPWVPTL